jgi:hypothetical protein
MPHSVFQFLFVVLLLEGCSMKTRMALAAVALFQFVVLGTSAASAQTMGGRTAASGSGSMITTSTTPGVSTGTVITPGIGYGGGGYSPGYGTIAGSSFAGLGAFASGLGEYNYNTALAIRQLEEANRQSIDNKLYAEKSQIEMRRLNNIQWLADHPRSTPEQIAKINEARLPRRLSTSELDPTWGTIRWPAILQRPEFEKVRASLDDVFAHRSTETFGVGSPAYDEVQRLTREMRTALDDEHKSMTQMEWIQSMRFIESLAYESRFTPGAVVGMNLR